MNGPKLTQNLKRKRDHIDRIDAKILSLLNERARVVEQIKLIKRNEELSNHDPQREKKILARLAIINEGPLSRKEINEIYSFLLSFFRSRKNSSKKGRQKIR